MKMKLIKKLLLKVISLLLELNVDIHQDFQQDRVFQSCLSSPENDVVVQFLNGLDINEDSETAYMETSSSEQTLT
jgi:hypothetical protein